MKKLLRITAAAVIFSLILSAFCACSENAPSDGGSTTQPTESTALSGTENSVQAPTEGNTSHTKTDASTERSTEPSKQDRNDSLGDILTAISSYPQGTAGSTAKCVSVAIRLINFTEKNTADAESTAKEIEKYYASLSEAKKAQFESNLYEIDYTARKLISGKTDSLKNYIDSSEEKYNPNSYSSEKYDELYKLLANS